MEIDGQILQFGGSLIAIFALAGLAWSLGLGGTPKLSNERQVRQAANEVFDGFEPDRIAISANGAAAILNSADGEIMVIRRHGNQFAGRILGPDANAQIRDSGLLIDSGEARYGSLTLLIERADVWAKAINSLEAKPDA